MADRSKKEYVVIVQCHIVTERCSGYGCEKALHERTGGFSSCPEDRQYRAVSITCGGCCGLAVHRKLGHLVSSLQKHEGIEKDRIAVQLASCITRDNYHGPPCPHLDYLKTLISRLGLDTYEDTVISEKARRRREEGLYAGPDQGPHR